MAEFNESGRDRLVRGLVKRSLVGAGLALGLMVVFLSGAIDDYGLLILAPLFTVSVGGALGGIFYHVLAPHRHQLGWKRVLAYLACLLGYVFLLWFSSIPGLAVVGLWD